MYADVLQMYFSTIFPVFALFWTSTIAVKCYMCTEEGSTENFVAQKDTCAGGSFKKFSPPVSECPFGCIKVIETKTATISFYRDCNQNAAAKKGCSDIDIEHGVKLTVCYCFKDLCNKAVVPSAPPAIAGIVSGLIVNLAK
nr:uncharacterized protein LOC128672933 [Plodia interpunctella]